MTDTKRRDLVRVLIGQQDTTVLSDSDLDIFLEIAEDEDESGNDDYAIALLACSKIAQTNMWKAITRHADGTQIKTQDTFEKLLERRLFKLGKKGLMISDTVYTD